MTSHAGETVLIELPIYLRVLRESASKHTDRIVAAIAMPSELDTLGVRKDVDASPIKRGAEGIRVKRLPPLTVSLLVAMLAILRGRKSSRLHKTAVLHDGVAWRGKLIQAEAKVISPGDIAGVIGLRC